MAILDDSTLDHERIVIRQDPRAGLRAIVAVHNRNLGPAIGGCRMLPYPSLEAALTDVVRLSRGMTYKCAIAGIPYGGGKSVVLADPARDKTPALLHAMGDFVDELGGAYITSFDAGITLDDVRTMGTRTAHVAGFAPGFGDPAASTALGL
ncbi:MAG: amino acid dehydrogenase, partial [Alphaproteobacteria bacterium]|nr:amino acid dehydrogenase [Alphaproteobacteria bacterium]